MRLLCWTLLICLHVTSHAWAADATTQPTDQAQATRISYHVKDDTPEAAFAKFAKATGTEFQPSSFQIWNQESASRVTLDFEDATYWKVMGELSAATGIYPQRLQDGKLVLARDDGRWAALPAVVSGPFRINVTELNATRQITLGREPIRSVHESLVFGVDAEPGLHPSVCEIALDTATDQAGLPINQAQMGGPPSPFNGNHASLFLGIDPPPTSTKIAKIQVHLAISTIAASQPIQVESFLDAEAKHQIAGIDYTFSAKSMPGGYQVSIQLFNASADPDLWKRIRPTLNNIRPRLLDDKEGAYQLGGWGNGSRGAAYISFSYNFALPPGLARPKTGRPQKLLWEIPTKLIETQIPATFENLPLH